MDAEHRHELKTNELADFLGHLPEFIRKYSNQIIGVILILIALVVIPLYSRMRRQTALAEEAAMISKIQIARESMFKAAQDMDSTNPAAAITAAAEDLEEAVQTTKNANLAALALLEKSELLRAELHLSKEVTADMISANLSKARTACEQAFEKAQSSTLKGLAELGLGLCAEEAGEYDNAREIYQKIVEKTEYTGTGVIEQAQRRLLSLNDHMEKVTFVAVEEEPQAEVTTSPSPVDLLGSLESSLPSISSDELTPIQPIVPPSENTDTSTP